MLRWLLGLEDSVLRGTGISGASLGFDGEGAAECCFCASSDKDSGRHISAYAELPATSSQSKGKDTLTSAAGHPSTIARL